MIASFHNRVKHLTRGNDKLKTTPNLDNIFQTYCTVDGITADQVVTREVLQSFEDLIRANIHICQHDNIYDVILKTDYEQGRVIKINDDEPQELNFFDRLMGDPLHWNPQPYVKEPKKHNSNPCFNEPKKPKTKESYPSTSGNQKHENFKITRLDSNHGLTCSSDSEVDEPLPPQKKKTEPKKMSDSELDEHPPPKKRKTEPKQTIDEMHKLSTYFIED
jgi:hypothetical protein